MRSYHAAGSLSLASFAFVFAAKAEALVEALEAEAFVTLAKAEALAVLRGLVAAANDTTVRHTGHEPVEFGFVADDLANHRRMHAV